MTEGKRSVVTVAYEVDAAKGQSNDEVRKNVEVEFEAAKKDLLANLAEELDRPSLVGPEGW